MLEYIKANVSRQYNENKETAEKLQDLLKVYIAKLKDLDQALKDAKDLVNKANMQNGLNGQALGDLQVWCCKIQNIKIVIQAACVVKGEHALCRNVHWS